VKPDDFFVGVLDFFSVLLPGVVVVAAAHVVIAESDPTLAFTLQRYAGTSGTASWWIALAIASYLAGHLVFLLAATLDTSLFDPLRVTWVPPFRDDPYEAAKEAQEAALGDEPRASNVYQWARLTLQLDAPTSYADVLRHEADSKFFRSFVVVLYALVGAALVAGRPRGAWWSPATVSLALGLVPLVGMWAWDERTARHIGRLETGVEKEFEAYGTPIGSRRRERRARRSAAVGSRRRAHRDRRREVGRWWSLLLLLFPILTIAFAPPQRRGVVTLLFVLLALSVWRYCERRWKGMTIAYRTAVVLASRPKTPAR
jgi:hypothetical protein